MERRQVVVKKDPSVKETRKKGIDDGDDGEEIAYGGDRGNSWGGGAEEEKRRRLSPPATAEVGGSGGGGGASSLPRRAGSGGGSGSQPCCQAEKCAADLTEAKRYHRRHKVCEVHSKASVVIVAGLRQRFCQQCSRFHELSEFDDSKRSCRRRLAGHNERRRKSSSESQGEGSNRCSQVDQSGKMQPSLPGTPTYKHFQIR